MKPGQTKNGICGYTAEKTAYSAVMIKLMKIETDFYRRSRYIKRLLIFFVKISKNSSNFGMNVV